MGWEGLAPHCSLSMGLDGMATAAKGSGLPPWSLKGGFAGEGSTLGARSLALRSQLPGVIWGRLSQGLGWSVVTASLLLASGFPRVLLGNLLPENTLSCSPEPLSQTPLEAHPRDQALSDKFLG